VLVHFHPNTSGTPAFIGVGRPIHLIYNGILKVFSQKSSPHPDSKHLSHKGWCQCDSKKMKEDALHYNEPIYPKKK